MGIADAGIYRDPLKICSFHKFSYKPGIGQNTALSASPAAGVGQDTALSASSAAGVGQDTAFICVACCWSRSGYRFYLRHLLLE